MWILIAYCPTTQKQKTLFHIYEQQLFQFLVKNVIETVTTTISSQQNGDENQK